MEVNYLDLESEVNRITRAIAIRDPRITEDLIADLKTRMTLDIVAGILLISLERLLRIDSDTFLWAIENLIPLDVMGEIQRLISLSCYHRLICQGFEPGGDFSVDAEGRLLLNSQAQAAILA